jgi:hypothetical protein
MRAPLTGGSAPSPVAALGHAAAEIALLRKEHRAEARVWLAFVAQAAVSGPLADTVQTSYAALQDLFTRLIAEAAASSGPRKDSVPFDPGLEARVLLALTDGLTAHVLIGHLTPENAAGALDAHLISLRERLRPPGPE